jgi:hypothetical protein
MSVVNEIYGLHALAETKRGTLRDLVVPVREIPVRSVVTNFWYFPEVMGALYFERDFHFIPENATDEDWQELLAGLISAGESELVFIGRNGARDLPSAKRSQGFRARVKTVVKPPGSEVELLICAIEVRSPASSK